MITIQAGYALVLDDEPANRDFLERLLQTANFKVMGAATGAEGLRIARACPALALALVDQQLPDATGLEVIAQLRAENPEALLVMATMHDDRALIDQAFQTGVDVFLVKPHGFMELYQRLQAVDSNTELLRQLVIDQFGPRPYRGNKTATQPVKRVEQPTPQLITPAAPPETKHPASEPKAPEPASHTPGRLAPPTLPSVTSPAPAQSQQTTSPQAWKQLKFDL